ncbi:YhgE/Pip family protein [Streptomyces sp. NPDC088729]|uniref:YhgE/Pip family protein n=1 Tax=Streptomyces sp. NPDC088729 TaxID=3365876 RepID=UPI00382E74B3
MRALRLAWLEFQRFRGPRLQWVPALLILIPLVGSALCLLSLQDPQGRMRDTPAAIVDLDRPSDMRQEPGEPAVRMDVGKRLTEEVRLNHAFAWRNLPYDTAVEQLRRGEVYLVLVIPEDFSSKIAEGLSGKPAHASLTVEVDDAHGYLVGLSATAYAERIKNEALNIVLGYEAQQTTDVWADVRKRVNDVLKLETKLKSGEGEQPPGAQPPASGTEQIAKQMEEMKATLSQLNDTLQSANGNSGTMASQLNEAAATAQSAQESSGSGNGPLITQNTTQTGNSVRLAQGGVTALNGKLQEAASSTKSLLDRLTPLINGSKALTTSVSALEKELQDLAKSIPAASVSASHGVQSPISVQEKNHHPARTLARGIAPFALSLLSCVSVLVALTVLGRASSRGVASPINAFAIARASWLPIAVISALSTCGLFAFGQALLSLDAVHPWAAVVLCVLTGFGFAALGHVLKAAAGILGEGVFFLLLAVQFGGAGGLYPVETTNALFSGLHPYLPMTYSVEGLRMAVSGGPTSYFWAAAGVMAGLMAVCLALSTLCVARRRQWTGERMGSPFRDRC